MQVTDSTLCFCRRGGEMRMRAGERKRGMDCHNSQPTATDQPSKCFVVVLFFSLRQALQMSSNHGHGRWPFPAAALHQSPTSTGGHWSPLTNASMPTRTNRVALYSATPRGTIDRPDLAETISSQGRGYQAHDMLTWTISVQKEPTTPRTCRI